MKVIESLRSVFSGVNVLKTHLVWLAVLLTPAISSGATDIFKNKELSNLFEINTIITIGVLLIFLISLVFQICNLGYRYEFIHCFLQEGKAELPKFSFMASFNHGIKSVPFLVVWILYYCLILTVVGLISLFFGFALPGLVIFLVYLIIAVLAFYFLSMLVLIEIRYSENLIVKKDLYDFCFNFNIFKSLIKKITVLNFKFIPVCFFAILVFLIVAISSHSIVLMLKNVFDLIPLCCLALFIMTLAELLILYVGNVIFFAYSLSLAMNYKKTLLENNSEV